MVDANKEKYGIDNNARLTFDKGSGSFYVGRIKVGFVTIGEDVLDDGSYPVSFQTNPREANLVKMNYDQIANDFKLIRM